MIAVAQPELFDYSAGEPGPEYLTVLRALNVSERFREFFWGLLSDKMLA